MSFTSDDPNRYDDIINLPHHVSPMRPHMSLYDRAAQFAPFKALSGYEDDISEEARLTDDQIALDENRIAVLDARLQVLEEHLSDSPKVVIRYFHPDERKAGGAYLTFIGSVKRIDPISRTLILPDGSRIPMEHIVDLQGELFGSLGEAAEF